jgi:hypothetical protein
VGTRLQATWPALELRATEAGGGTWNLARQLGRSHWEADTVLHLELREQARDELHLTLVLILVLTLP